MEWYWLALIAAYFSFNLSWAWSEFKEGSRNWADLVLKTFFGFPMALWFIGRMIKDNFKVNDEE